jgi:CheY-like chemotaxis protein
MMEQQKKQVLLVEDMPDIRELLRTVLENADYAVIAVEDGQTALEVLKTTACDVMVKHRYWPGTGRCRSTTPSAW